jgi:hypothetical protein
MENKKMTHLLKWIGKLLFFVMGAALVVYAATRTLNFIDGTLGADDQIIGLLALFATTGGAIAWLLVFLHNSEGIAQKGIALVMVVIDIFGEIALFTIDTLLQSGVNGITETLPAEDIRLTVLGMSALIGANIIATFAFHIVEPENMQALDQHFRDARKRKADHKIEDAIIEAQVAKAENIADEIASREAESYAQEQRNKDRVNYALPAKTLGEEWGEAWQKAKSLIPGKNSNGAKPKTLPRAASETIGIPKLTKTDKKYYFRGEEISKEEAREIYNLFEDTGANKQYKDDLATEKEEAQSAPFQDIPQSQDGGQDGGYIPSQEAV